MTEVEGIVLEKLRESACIRSSLCWVVHLRMRDIAGKQVEREVKRALRRLRRAGLVEFDGGFWRALPVQPEVPT